jgi:DnaK suppressor protein
VSTNQDLKKIKASLIERKNELKEHLHKLSTEKVSDEQGKDPGDQALSATMENLRSSLQDTELQEYKRIKQALAKIEDGTYGICIDCGSDISEKRLKWHPNAARCLACQEAFEDKR